MNVVLSSSNPVSLSVDVDSLKTDPLPLIRPDYSSFAHTPFLDSFL